MQAAERWAWPAARAARRLDLQAAQFGYTAQHQGLDGS